MSATDKRRAQEESSEAQGGENEGKRRRVVRGRDGTGAVPAAVTHPMSGPMGLVSGVSFPPCPVCPRVSAGTKLLHAFPIV